MRVKLLETFIFEDSLEVLESRRQVGEDRSSSGALALRP
jgi:hypothetical protein